MARQLSKKAKAEQWFAVMGRVADLRLEISNLEDAALAISGWQHTSQTPGEHLMWEKVIAGRTFLVRRTDAILVESRLAQAAFAGRSEKG